MEALPPAPQFAATHSPPFWLRVTGAIVCAIAAVVALGWITAQPALTEWLPHGSDMVMNAAACVFLAGLGLFAVAGRRRTLTLLCGAATLLLAAAVLTRRWFGWWPGLDEMLWVHAWGAPDLPRGQTAPNTAAAFLVIGAALVVIALPRRASWLLPLMSGVVIAFALLPPLAYLAQWFGTDGAFYYRGMALPAALSLTLIAGSLLLAARLEGMTESIAQSLLTAALGMLVSIGVVTIQANAGLVQANARVTHSYEVRGRLDNLVAEVARMESTVRAYALTGDDFFRARFDAHKAALLDDLATVRREVADNRVQSERGERLQVLAQRKIEQGAALLRAGETAGPEGAARYLRSLDRQDTSALVILSGEMRAEEDRLLATRAAAQHLAQRDTHIVLALGGSVALALLVAALVSARRSTQARRVAESDLRESEERFRHAFEGAGVGMALVGLDGRWLRVNAAVCEIVGYPAAELLKKTFQDITHPDDLAMDLDHVHAVIDGRERTYRIEKRYLHRAGHVVWISLTVSLIRDAGGAPLHFVSQIEDISRRKQLEQELRVARDEALAAQADLSAINRLHRAVLDGNDFAIIATDADGLIRVFSAGAQKMLGYAAAEVLGRATLERLHTPMELRARADELGTQLGIVVAPGFESLVAAARRGRADEREWTYVRRDGSQVPVRLSVTALRDETGGITGFLGIAQDLSQHKKIEVALQASEERLLQVLGKADCLVWEAEVRLRGDDWDWHFVVQPSAMYRRLFGVDPRGESAGLWYRFEVPERLEMNQRCREAILGGLPGYEQEFRIVREGQITWIHESVSITQPEPGDCWLVGVATDVTERKRLEENLGRARDEALAVSRLKSEFLATMSHEIRTPMNGVLGMVGLLADTPLNSEQQEMVRVAQNSAEGLLSVINDILDFSKIEAGKLRFEPHDFDLQALIEETLTLLGPRAHQKSLELIGVISGGLAGCFFGDAGRIRQVLTNLVGNAIKFTDAGEVRVRARIVREDGRAALARISVEDTGIGIPSELQPRLFHAFSQVDGSATRRFGGTGLGLAISRQLVTLMGGEIGFTSEVGRGSEFWFELPLPRRPAPSAEAPPSALAGRHVLVVDDNETNLRVLAGQLRRHGLAVETAATGPAALARLWAAHAAAAPFDAALVDWHMPGMSGIELAREIGGDSRIGATPLLLLSSSGDRHDETLATTAKLVAVLTKPVPEAQLLAALRRALAPAPDSGETEIRLAPQPRQKLAPQRKLHVLLVEDTPANQIVGQMLLEKLGHTVEIVDSGVRALARLASTPRFDVVLMDCQMPGIDGYETTRRIRAGAVPDLDSQLPIIALTAYAMPEDRAKCLAAGMDDYLSKPIDPEALRAVLASCGFESAPAPAPAGPDTPAPLDARIVSALRTLPGRTGPSLWPELIAMYREHEETALASIERLAAERNARVLATAAHTLAGSCASIGARAMQTVALGLERAALGDNWVEVSQKLAELRIARGTLRAALASTEPTAL